MNAQSIITHVRAIGSLYRFALLPALYLILTTQPSEAGSATWNLNAIGGWTTAANWTPATVPDGPSDIATFGVSNETEVFIFPDGFIFQIEVNAIDFLPGASSFSFFADSGLDLLIDGTGIHNHSGVLQTFTAGIESPILFANGATAGDNTLFTNFGGASEQPGGATSFSGTATAGSATFNNKAALEGFNNGATKFQASANAHYGTFNNLGALISGGSGGATTFSGSSDAAHGTFNNFGTLISGGSGGMTFFNVIPGGISSAGQGIFHSYGASFAGTLGEGFVLFANGAPTAGNGTFVNDGGLVSGAPGGLASFAGSATGGDASFVNHGGAVAGAGGGLVMFSDTSTAGNATLINEDTPVSGAAGGMTQFLADSTGGTARTKVSGGGKLDLSSHNAPGVTVGSIEGTGLVSLGANNLTVGSNNRNVTFSGVIDDGGLGGSLTKIGTGTLVLAGPNTYTGDTVVESGILLIRSGFKSH
jgi:autotransporter-associated beta strand protein